MSSRIRFNEAGDVFAAFPELARFAPPPSAPVDALDYARSLVEVTPPSAAVTYIAHLLPRREAVWWGCQCVAAMLGAAGKDEASRLAETWVRAPDEDSRRAALNFAQAGDLRVPTVWLARAAGYSGGSIAPPDQPPNLPAPEACAQSINAAIVVAATLQSPYMILGWFKACAEAGARFAAGEDAKVIAPPPLNFPGSPQAASPAA